MNAAETSSDSSCFSAGETRSSGSSTPSPADNKCPSMVKKEYVGSELAWSSLSVEHKGKMILENATGRAKPGQLTTLMGHSGSGKTTLLKALTGRGLLSSGRVLLGGTQVDPGSPRFQRIVPFVADRETVEATATCIEVITFSASLRLPPDTSKEAIKKLVKDIIALLKLEACAQTQCRRLSCGERRRLSVAVELVVKPKTLVLDEPTSGLDSFHGVVLLQCLKQVANGGTSILLSIHHPNLIMWDLMDHVILLHGGKLMIQGSGASIVDAFERNGFQLPPNENPADWIMAMAQTEKAVWSVDDAYHLPSTDVVPQEIKESAPAEIVALVDNNRAGPLKECSILLAREWHRAIRDTDAMFPRFLLSIVGGAAFAIVFAGVADGTIDSVNDLSAHAGSLFFLFLCGSIVAPSIMMDAIKERPVFEREYRTGHYRIWTYILCKSIADAVTLFIMAVCISVISFYAVGLQGRFWYLLLLYFVFGWVFTLIAVIIVAASKDPTSSVDYVGFIFLPMALLSGFYVPVDKLPLWLQWAPWTMPFTWAFRLALEEEFSFCATPSERDGHLLNCMKGLQENIFEASFDNPSVNLAWDSIYNLEQTGVYKGPAALYQYRNLLGFTDNPEGHLVYDACKDGSGYSDLILHSISESHCSITSAGILSGRVNPLHSIDPDNKFETVLGMRLDYTMTPEGAVIVDEASIAMFKDDLLPSMLDEHKIANRICDTLENVCGSEYNTFENRWECLAAMTALPVAQKNDHGVAALTGNSTGCRMVQELLVRENPDNCAHISLPRQADASGKFMCVDENINRSYHNFTEEEENMFQKVAVNNGLFDAAQGRAFVSRDDSECIDDPIGATDMISVLQDNGEFEDMNPYCYGYLQQNDATSEFTAVYWSALLGTVVLARVLTGVLMRFQAHRRD